MPSIHQSDTWQMEGFFASLLASYARRFPAHPCKLRIVNLLSTFLRQARVRHPGGGLLRFVPGDYLAWALLVQGSFEPRSLALAISLMSKNGVLLDVGANLGLFSVATAAATGCHVVAIEPEPVNFARLQENLSLNPDLAITPVNCAATPSSMEVVLENAQPGLHAWTRVNPQAADGGIRVPGRPLERILQDAGIAAVELLKIDVEGYEPEALAGLDWSGPRRPRHVLMECSPTDAVKLRFMAERGFVARTIDGAPTDGLAEFPEGNVHFVSRT